jgi:hypothetical protein
MSRKLCPVDFVRDERSGSASSHVCMLITKVSGQSLMCISENVGQGS